MYNSRAAGGESANALRAAIEAAVELGVHYVQATVTKVHLEPDGACMGVVTDDGMHLIAEHVILCTGAHKT